jgi:hypothetical protein
MLTIREKVVYRTTTGKPVGCFGSSECEDYGVRVIGADEIEHS